jgi:hypothetical protein
MNYICIKGYPELSLTHLKRLTDCFGIIQHSKYGIPDKRTGYTTDDNARALLVITKYWNIIREEELLELARIYLGFIWYVLKDDGWLHNFVSYERVFLDDIGSEDSFGRAFLACAYTYNVAPTDISLCAKEILDRMKIHMKEIKSPRAVSFLLAGSTFYRDTVETVSYQAERMLELYRKSARDDWKWIEPYLAYDNGIIPAGFLSAYLVLKDTRYLEAGLEILDFLAEYSFKNGIFVPPGNEKWELNINGEGRPMFDQQPLEVSSFIEACKVAFHITKNDKYIKLAMNAFDWFFGKNIIGEDVYDSSTKACRDGINRYGLNLNAGAESIISYLSAYLSVYEMLTEETLNILQGVV